MAVEHTAIIARNETWTGDANSEPYEAGWAREAVLFLRSLRPPSGKDLEANVQISPDGIRWVDEGSRLLIPNDTETVAVARISHFGNWIRFSTDLGQETCCLLATLHLKE